MQSRLEMKLRRFDSPVPRARRAAVSLVVMLGVAQVFAAGGCNNQGEGERCTHFPGGDAGENGSDECSSGLVCTPTDYYTTSTALGGQTVGTLGVCCPPAGTASSVPACNQSGGGSFVGGPTGDGGFDGHLESSVDGARRDASTEAGARDGGAHVDGTTVDGTAAPVVDGGHAG